MIDSINHLLTIKIANGAGFLGDNLDAPRLLVERRVNYLTLEYLAELTMSILARAAKGPAAGYARDFLDVCNLSASVNRPA